jgi:hypothetical protein
MKRALALPVLLIGLFIQTSSADAQSFHEKVDPKEIKKGGQVVGLRLKLTLRPESGSTQDKVRVGLGSMKTPANAPYDWHRAAASDASKGYLVHQWPEIAIDPKTDKAKEVTLEVLYADVPGLEPGSEVEVISTWNAPNNRTYWHVWGIQSVYKDPKSVIKLPLVKPPAAKEAAAKPAAKPAAAKPAAKPAAAKPAAAKPAAAKPTAARTRKPRATTPKPRRTVRTVQQRRVAARTALRARARLRHR